jgi:hypothetical protein
MFTHPSVAPGAIIGYRKNGTPIRLIAGASEGPAEPAAPPAPPAPAPTAPATDPAPPAADPAPASGQEPPAPAAEAVNVEQLPAWAQKLIRDTRKEAADGRTKAKEHSDALAALQQKSQQQLDGIARALGLKPEEATPEQILAERDAARAASEASARQARETAVELAVFRAATAAQVNGNALLDSRAFVRTLDGLDPAAADFGQRVSDAISAAVDANPSLKAAATAAPAAAAARPAEPQSATTAPPARSGGEHNGSPGGQRQWTQADLDALPKTREGNKALEEAIDAGLLTDLGVGPRKSRR